MNENESSEQSIGVAPAPVAPAPASDPRPLSYPALLMRWWTLRSTDAAPLRHSGLFLVFLSALWLLLWIAIDWWNADPDWQPFLDYTPLFAWYALAVLALAALLRWRSTPTPKFGPVLALSIGLVPLPVLLAAFAAPLLNPIWLLVVVIIAISYSFIYLARGLRSFTGAPQRAAAAAGIVFILCFMWLSDALDVVPAVWLAGESQAAPSEASPADAESILFEQPGRIDRALGAFKFPVSAKGRAFFVGFAGVGDEKVFAQEVGLASRVLA
ncbi:MAG TPA: hypothetical protein VGH12_06270, partial [Steroidobacteraceae bacterium]